MIFVDEAAVAGPVRAAAEAMAAFVCEDLELEPCGVIWYEGSSGVWGVYVAIGGAAPVVALNSRRSARQVARTVAHELRHHWQDRQGILSGEAGPDLERDARRYAAAASRCMVAGSGATV